MRASQYSFRRTPAPHLGFTLRIAFYEPSRPSRCHAKGQQPILPRNGGGSWTSKTSYTCRCFRDDEQAPQRIPVRDEGKAWPADRSRQQGTHREGGKK